MLDPRGQLLRAAVGFAGRSMPSYDRALGPLRSRLDSWPGVGRVAAGMRRQGFDLQLPQYGDRGWRATWEAPKRTQCLKGRLAGDRGRRAASLGPIHSPLGVPDVEAPHMELKRLGIVLADAVHHQLVLRDELAARVAGLALGHTPEDLGALVAGQDAAGELFTDEYAQRRLRLHDDHLIDRMRQSSTNGEAEACKGPRVGTGRYDPILPMQLQMGDRLTDETGEWEGSADRTRRPMGRPCPRSAGAQARRHRDPYLARTRARQRETRERRR
jgi:hypothetical protein